MIWRLRRRYGQGVARRPTRLTTGVRLFVVGVIATSAVVGIMTESASAAVKTLPEPPQAVGGSISATSCVTGPVCVAIGWNHHGNTGYLWTERWRDGQWSKLSAPPGVTPGGDELALSCVTSGWCMMTGSPGITLHDHPFAETLVGTRWTSLPVPVTEGSTDFTLNELQCRSSTWCIGVGSYVANRPNYDDATFLVSEVWNGSTWRLVPVYSPRTYAPQIDPGSSPGGEHPTASPQQLSCVSHRFCVFAGFWRGDFAESWNGQRWSKMTTPDDPARPAGDSEFSGGTCVSTTFCVAAGGYAVSNGAWRPLIERWNGEGWRIMALPSLPKRFRHGTGFRLTATQCVSTSYCVVYGDPGFAPTGLDAMRWNGEAWRYVSLGGFRSPRIVCLALDVCAVVD